MRNFGLSLFGGYKKDEVNEYIEHLVEELETLKDQRTEPSKELQDRLEKLEQQLEEKQRQLDLQKERLEAEEKKAPKEDESAATKIRELEEKLKEYEEHSDSVNRVLSLAEKTVYEAKEEAAKIVAEGKARAEEYRRKTERNLDKKRKKNEDEFMLAKYKLMSYLKSLNDTQNKLITTYNELGELVEKLPLRIGDILSDEPFELLDDESKPEEEKA